MTNSNTLQAMREKIIASEPCEVCAGTGVVSSWQNNRSISHPCPRGCDEQKPTAGAEPVADRSLIRELVSAVQSLLIFGITNGASAETQGLAKAALSRAKEYALNGPEESNEPAAYVHGKAFEIFKASNRETSAAIWNVRFTADDIALYTHAPDSSAEIERLSARVAELEADLHGNKAAVLVLRQQLHDATARLEASDDALKTCNECIGWLRNKIGDELFLEFAAISAQSGKASDK